MLATCGAGKTSVVSKRIVNLIKNHNVNPSNILCISFTKRAVSEMKERTIAILTLAKDTNFSTFHALAYQVFIKYGSLFGYKTFNIISSKTVRSRVIQKMVEAQGSDDDSSISNTIVQEFMACYKNVKIFDYTPLEAFPNKFDRDVFYEVEETLQDNQEVTFDDLLYYTVKFFDKNSEKLNEFRKKFHYILVDEMQDTNLMQFKILGQLNYTNNVMAVGDANQSCFSFSGARVQNIMDFEHKYNAQIYPLSVNFRSTPEIVAVFNKLIDYNIYPERFKFRAESFKESIGVKPKFILFENRDNQAMSIRQTIESAIEKGYDYKDITILYRNNVMSLAFEKELVKASIPFKVKGGSFLDRKEIRMILSCFKFVTPEMNKDLGENAYNIISNSRNGIGSTTILSLFYKAKEQGYKNFQDMIRDNKPIAGIGAKKLSSLKDIADLYDTVEACFIDSDIRNVDIDKLIETVKNLIEFGKMDKVPVQERFEYLDFFKEIWTDYLAEVSEDEKTLMDFLNKIMLNQGSYERDKNKRTEENEDAVKLSTIHSYKGAENKIVFLTNVQDGSFPMTVDIDDDMEYQNELNLLYVGVSRAKERMFVTSVGMREYETNVVLNLSFMQAYEGTDLLKGMENISFVKKEENRLLRGLI